VVDTLTEIINFINKEVLVPFSKLF